MQYYLISELGVYTVAASGASGASSGVAPATAASPTVTPAASPTTSMTTSATHLRLVAEAGWGQRSKYLDVGADGSDPHVLPLQFPCQRYLALTQDGRWGACWGQPGILTFRLPTVAPTSQADTALLEEHLILPQSLAQDDAYGDLTWDPTGRYLAIARLTRSASPSTAPLDVYAVSAAHDQARLVARISGPFMLDAIRWSPEGRWLLANALNPDNGNLLFPFWQLLPPQLPAVGAAPLLVTITLAQVRQRVNGVSWRMESDSAAALTWVDTGILYEQDVTTLHITKLGNLGFPPSGGVGYICAGAWTVDGRQFVFALCDPQGGDDPGLPPNFFVYTPPHV